MSWCNCGSTYGTEIDCEGCPFCEPNIVERIAIYIESESQCLMDIVIQETRHDYGVRLLKMMADEIRAKFGGKSLTQKTNHGTTE